MATENNAGKTRSNPSHEPWEFRRESAIWSENGPLFPNLYPIGNELRDWLLRQGELHYFAHSDKDKPNAPTNPFTYNGYILASTYATIVNESHAFSTSVVSAESEDSEIEYIRLYSELMLYTTRLCETLIKQLLFCTTFSPDQYELSALGGLLSSRCKACNAGQKKHYVSLLGSLAHRYGLCRPYEDCLHGKMRIVNDRRNNNAAHSGIIEFRGRSSRVCRKELSEAMVLIGNEFIHMLNHIGDLESRMIQEINTLIRYDRTATIEVRFPFKSDSLSET